MIEIDPKYNIMIIFYVRNILSDMVHLGVPLQVHHPFRIVTYSNHP